MSHSDGLIVYLHNREQIVSINDLSSDPVEVNYSVLQGSILGSLLFVIYINNLDKLQLFDDLFFFADNTAVIFKGYSWDEVDQTAAVEMLFIKTWFNENILTMNVSKIKRMAIALRIVSELAVDHRLATLVW